MNKDEVTFFLSIELIIFVLYTNFSLGVGHNQRHISILFRKQAFVSATTN